MPAPFCPYCGTQCTAVGETSFRCSGCGKTVEPPSSSGGEDRWSEGPPADSANRWSAQPPLGEDSTSSESVSQGSFLPGDKNGQAAFVRPPASPLVWALVVLAIFLASMIGVIMLARSIRPWLAQRKAAAQRATVEYWLPRLEKGDDESRREAARAIVDLGPQAVGTTLDHISRDAGEKQDFPVAQDAVQALAAVGADAVPALCVATDSTEAKIRGVGIEVLAQMGGAARAARDKLLAALDDPDRRVRCHAIDALGYLGADGAVATKSLGELLAGPDSQLRMGAIVALGHIGPGARDALPTLRKAAADPDPEISAAASKAVKQIDVESLALDACRNATGETREQLKALEADDAAVAVAAAESLSKLGFAGQSAVPGLALMLRSDDRGRRLAAATAMGQLGLAAADFAPTLEVAARDEDAEVRAAATKALAPRPKPATAP